jgi:hypothetical protein
MKTQSTATRKGGVSDTRYIPKEEMMKRLFIVLSISLIAINAFAGSSSIKILEIEPNPQKSLKVGSEIHFKVKLEYNVSDDSAVANLIFQKGEDIGSFDSVVGNTMQVINKGKGTITLVKKNYGPRRKSSSSIYAANDSWANANNNSRYEGV